MAPPKNLILASSSPYRAAALSQLKLHFQQVSPVVDEFPIANELPKALAERLSIEKARAIAVQHRDAIVIGSDQVGWMNNKQLHKPGNIDAAHKQLIAAQGQTATFYTGLAVCCPDHPMQTDVVETKVEFTRHTDEFLRRYVEIDQPTNCAGAFKAEALGIVLFNSITSSDPSALIGLPLIKLSHMLRRLGVDFFPLAQ